MLIPAWGYSPIPHAEKPSIAVLLLQTSAMIRSSNISAMGSPKTSSPSCRDSIVVRHRPQLSLRLQRKTLKVQDIARELGVAYVVEGSVRRAADRVRITAQLVDAATGNHLWAERYDRECATFLPSRTRSPGPSRRRSAEGWRRPAVTTERLSPTGLRAYHLVLRAER